MDSYNAIAIFRTMKYEKSLLSIFNKIYERIIHQHLEKHLMENKIIINE